MTTNYREAHLVGEPCLLTVDIILKVPPQYKLLVSKRTSFRDVNKRLSSTRRTTMYNNATACCSALLSSLPLHSRVVSPPPIRSFGAAVPTLFGNRSARTYSPQRDEDDAVGPSLSHNCATIITFCCSRSSFRPSVRPSSVRCSWQ